MRTKVVRNAILLLSILCLPAIVFAQHADNCLRPQPRVLTDYLEERICKNLKARVDQTDPTKQSAPPAAAGNSTSLVERSSAPDLLGFGLDLLNLSDASKDKKSATPKTLTFSAYALKSALASQDPLDPEIYNKNSKWRSVSFTVGYDVPEDTNARDPVIGIKWLAYNGRDVSTSDNQNEILKIQSALDGSAIAFSALRGDVRLYLFDILKKRGASMPNGVTITTLEDFNINVVSNGTKVEAIVGSLSDDEQKNIDAIISKHISAFANLDRASKDVVTTIRTKPQLALAFTTTQRKRTRPDEYSGVVTFDKGMGTHSITMNGSFIFKKSVTGKDSRGGQFAAAIHLPLQAFKPLGYKDPLLLSIEANATGMTGERPMYKAQAKLTIPLLPGMEIPISVSVANRSEFVKEKEVKGKFGFTFDISKAMKAFRDGFQKR